METLKLIRKSITFHQNGQLVETILENAKEEEGQQQQSEHNRLPTKLKQRREIRNTDTNIRMIEERISTYDYKKA